MRLKDMAHGISEDDIKIIFDQFKTLKDGGAGLGLAFCKVVMHSYGGDIICESEVDKYTEFKLSFPKVV